MEITISLIIAKPDCKTLPGDKTLEFEPAIHFYGIEDDDNTEEGE